jgi:Toprim domain-containing protein
MRTATAPADSTLPYETLAGCLGLRPRADVPCPECGPQCSTKGNARKPVLRVWRKDVGFLTYLCARCGVKGYAHEQSADWRKHISSDLPKRSSPIGLRQEANQEERDRLKYAHSVFMGAGHLKGSLGENYLASRAIRLDEDLHHVLRFHPALTYEGRKVPAIVALFRDIVTDAPRGIHRIFLDPDGRKLERRMLGPTASAAIKLDASEDVVSGLHLGEGIETCLAARQLGFKPVWAMGSAGAIGAFPLLAGIEAISVLTENDRASHEAACAISATYEPAGAELYAFEAESGDINDALRRVVA